MDDASEFLTSVEKDIGGVPCDFSTFQPTGVFPGMDVTEIVSRFGKRIKLGQGLVQQVESIVATRSGILLFQKPNVYWVDHYDHRYRPRVGDNVVGVVREAFAENYPVDIASIDSALLPTLAFDGASKRNRPELSAGSLIYCRIEQVQDNIADLTCCAKSSQAKKDWMTGEAIYGELKGGCVFRCSLFLAETLLDPECPVLLALARSIPFEIAVGSNGFVWINAETPEQISLIMVAIQKSEGRAPQEIHQYVKDCLKRLKKKRH